MQLIDSFEIDFLQVGSGERSGDAIAMRFGNHGNYQVLVYDGGTKESGKELVNHIKTHYGTSYVDYVINSHPDADHASGLSVVLEEMTVGELWMHQPWNYSPLICNYFHDGRITDNSLAERLQRKMAAAYSLEKLAERKGILIKEPFRGAQIGPFTVLSPSADWYIHTLIPEFNKSPAQKNFIMEAFLKAASNLADWVTEGWDKESLRDNVTTSAENESSVVILGQLADKVILLTGDAGIRALSQSVAYLEALNISLPTELHFLQVPHHGSRNNVSSSVLDRILGNRKVFNDGITSKVAYVSAAKGSNTHPRQSVVNAFIRRGVQVHSTNDGAKCYFHNMPVRGGWGPIYPLQFSDKVEQWN